MNRETRALAARRKHRNLLGAIGVLALVLLSAASFESYRDLREGRGHERELRREIAAADRRIGELERRVERLQQDPAILEELAREELMMARPGEVVIVVPEGFERATETSTAGNDHGEAGNG